LHRDVRGASFKRNFDFLRVWIAKAESHAIVRLNFRRNYGSGWLLLRENRKRAENESGET
jgi:hypothetical protein